MSLRTWFNPTIETTSSQSPASAATPRRPRRRGAGLRALASALRASFGEAPSMHAPSNRFAEALEPRTLLTQLVGGQEFYFVQRHNDQQLVHRVRLEGNIEVEIVGSEVDEHNNIHLRNLAGSIYSNNVFVRNSDSGGLTPAVGSLSLGGVSIPGIVNPTINAIAAQNDGDVYAFNVIQLQDQGGGGGGGTQTDTAQIQLVQLNIPAGGFGPVTSTVIVDDLGAGLGLTDVTGADFDPVTGQLFFAASVEDITGGGGGGGTQSGSLLISMNVDAANPNATLGVIGTFVETAPGQAPRPTMVSTITFRPDGTLAGVSEGGIFSDAPGTISPAIDSTEINVISGQGGSSEIQGLEFNPYTNDYLAVGTGGLDAEVLNVCDNGRALAYGPVGTGSLTNLTFVPGLPDPFTLNTDGAFVAIDSASDQMFYVSPVNRRPRQSLWNIYITQSDSTGRIAIGFVNTLDVILADPARLFDPMKPYEGSVGPLRVFNLNAPPQPIEVNADSTGQVLLGATTEPECNPNAVVGVPFDAPVGLPQLQPGQPTPFPLLPPSVTNLSPGISMNPGQTLGTFLLGGTLLGAVDARGSIDQMYVGWLLTGRSSGQRSLLNIERPENFHVSGDLRSLYTRGPIGTDATSAGLRDGPNYVTGFDMQVDGTLGHVETADSLYGSVEVENRPEDDATTGFPNDYTQSEMEFKTANTAPAFDSYRLSGFAGFFNDTFDTAEYRGTINSLGQDDIIRAVGTLQHTAVLQDWVDYYAVGVMSGQHVGVQLFSGIPALTGSLIQVGVFDPDGRLVASDYAGLRSFDPAGEYFEFTADRPGAYRIAVAESGNGTFANTAGPTLITIPYELRISKAGDIGLGGITAVNNIFDLFSPFGTVDHSAGEDPGFEVRNGDLGAIRAGNEFFSVNPFATVRVESGNMRSIDAASVGFTTGAAPDPNNPNQTATLNDPVQIDVPQGSVGLVRSRTGILFMDFTTTGLPIGGDFQTIDAATSFLGFLKANGGIGVIRAGDMQTATPSEFHVNEDALGNDGIIDLIDVTGNLGALGPGGPAITTGPGGNVRYMRVGGTAFIDAFFGGGSGGISTIHTPGETVALKDDSGSNIQLIPSEAIPNPAYDPFTNPNVPQFIQDAASLTVRSYPIQGSGGVVVIDVTSTDTVSIDAGAAGGSGTAEIGRVIVNGTGAVVERNPVVRIMPPLPTRRSRQASSGFEPFDPNDPGLQPGGPEVGDVANPFRLRGAPADSNGDGIVDQNIGNQPPNARREMDVVFTGNARVDVFDVIGGFDNTGAATGTPFSGNFNRIVNDTGGEIVSIHANNVAEIRSRGTVGVAESHIGAVPVNPRSTLPLPNAGLTAGTNGQGPFLDQHYGVAVTGNVASIHAGRGLGNIVVGGSIGEVNANDDDREDGVFEGIVGPIWAQGRTDATDPGGDILNVDIGEGIAPGGSGNFSRAGVFANRRLGLVQGTNADIRGDIFAGGSSGFFTGAGGGSAGGANGGTTQRPNQGNNGGNQGGGNQGGQGGQGGQGAQPLDLSDPLGPSAALEEIFASIGRVVLTGGSIINSDISVALDPSAVFAVPTTAIVQPELIDDVNDPIYEIGRVDVRNGGGIIGSDISAADVGPVTVKNGFGVFTSETGMVGEGRFKGIDTDGYGVRGYSVEGGASQNFIVARGDGGSISTANFDPNVRLSEQFEVDPFFGTTPNPLTDIHTVLGTSASTPEIPGRTDTGIIEDSSFRMQRNLKSVSAYEIRANNSALGISELNVGSAIGEIHVRHQINGLAVTTGSVGLFKPNGDVFNLNMTVAGPIKSLDINGDLADNSAIVTNGKVGDIRNVSIKGRLDGSVIANGRIGKMLVGAAVNGKIGSSRTKGKGNAINTLIIGGELGSGGLEIDGNIGKLQVGRDLGRTGENLFIRGSIKSLIVAGSVFSNVNVRDKLGSLKVGGAIKSGSTIEATQIGSISTGGDFEAGAIIRAKKVGKLHIGGQLLGTVEETG